MNLSVPRETAPGERRVALVPESCKKLVAAGYAVAVEAGAGAQAGFADQAYQAAGGDQLLAGLGHQSQDRKSVV